MQLPPGQRAVRGFPRFGVDLAHPPPAAPTGMTVDVVGELTRRVSLEPGDLAGLPRRAVTANFHCVAGWSALDLHWEGVAFADLYRLVVEPALAPGARVRHVVFVGLDGYRSIVALEDGLADDVLVADRLDGRPLSPEHGAPVRLVSPRQYGFVSVKHLSRIELYRAEPVAFFHPVRAVQRVLRTVHPHPRGRVWHEERHRYLPSWLVRRVYRLGGRLPAEPLSAGPPASATG